MSNTRIESHAAAAAACVRRGRPADSRKLANNTYIERRGADYALRLHETDIVTYRPDGSVVLSSGGWLTMTTAARLWDFGPVPVSSDKGVWRCAGVRFRDGIALHPTADGWQADTDDETRAAEAAADAHNAETRKAIARYVRGFQFTQTYEDMNATRRVDVAGDCFVCRAIVTDMDGRPSTDTGHIYLHMSERYYVPSLLLNAIGASNWQRADIMWTIERDGKLNTIGRRFVRNYLSKLLLVGVATQHGGHSANSDILAWYRATHPAGAQLSLTA